MNEGLATVGDGRFFHMCWSEPKKVEKYASWAERYVVATYWTRCASCGHYF